MDYSVGMTMNDRDMMSLTKRGGKRGPAANRVAVTATGYRQIGDSCEETYLNNSGQLITLVGTLQWSNATGGLVCVGPAAQAGLGQRITAVSYDAETGLPVMELILDERGNIVSTGSATPAGDGRPPVLGPGSGGGTAVLPQDPSHLPANGGDIKDPRGLPANGGDVIDPIPPNGITPNGNGVTPGKGFMGFSQQQITAFGLGFMAGKMLGR